MQREPPKFPKMQSQFSASTTGTGNVRELENILHSASVVCKGKRILVKDLPDSLGPLEKMSSQIATVDKTDQSYAELPAENTREFENPETSFGNGETQVGNAETLGSAPSSISLKSYDIAYAHTRKLTDSNLLDWLKKK